MSCCYESQYVGHRKTAEKRRKTVSEWLRQREREADEHTSPSVAPEPTACHRKYSPPARLSTD
jgi:hypothetical protein